MIRSVLADCTIVVRPSRRRHARVTSARRSPRHLPCPPFEQQTTADYTGVVNDSASPLIVVADDLPASALDLLRAEGWTVDARTGRAPDVLAADLANADALVVRSATKVTAAIINAAPKLRVIARAGTGDRKSVV